MKNRENSQFSYHILNHFFKNKLTLIITSGIIVLLLSRYYGKYFVVGNGFYALRIIVAFSIPILVNQFLLKFSWKEMGICKPCSDKNLKYILLLFCIVIPLVISLILLSDQYLLSYSKYRNNYISPYYRLHRFSMFTISTLLGWEFLHRSFILFGTKNYLIKYIKTPDNIAITISILWTMTFETLYHFIKPDLEAMGMLFISPIFSYLAFKTKSIFIPLFLHLYIEAFFIFILIFVS